MLSRIARTAVALALSTNLTGCYSTWDIQPRALIRLDGFRPGDKRSLGIVDGENLPFTNESKLYFHGVDDREAEMSFRAINVNYPIFTGQKAETGEVLYVDLSRLSEVKVRNKSEAKTTLALYGFALAGIGIVIESALILVIATTSRGP